MSKAGSGKEPISDKERLKAGIMTTNKKVKMMIMMMVMMSMMMVTMTV